MIKVAVLTGVLQETKSVVSFSTREGNRLDISKKFLHKVNGTYVFHRETSDHRSVTTLHLNRAYVVEINEARHAIGADGKTISIVKDIITTGLVRAFEKSEGLLEDIISSY